MKDVYSVTIWFATAGYLVLMHYVFFRVDPVEARVGKRFEFGVINACCAAVVIASALWMPVTFAYLEHLSIALWVLIRVDLIVVGIGAVGLLVTLFNLSPRLSGRAGVVTVIALLLFALQTAFIDPFVWPLFFGRS